MVYIRLEKEYILRYSLDTPISCNLGRIIHRFVECTRFRLIYILEYNFGKFPAAVNNNIMNKIESHMGNINLLHLDSIDLHKQCSMLN